MKSVVFVPPFWECDRSSLEQVWKWKTDIRKSLKKGWRKSESEVRSFIRVSSSWKAERKEEGQIHVILRTCYFPEIVVIRKRIQLTMQVLATLYDFPEKYRVWNGNKNTLFLFDHIFSKGRNHIAFSSTLL